MSINIVYVYVYVCVYVCVWGGWKEEKCVNQYDMNFKFFDLLWITPDI